VERKTGSGRRRKVGEKKEAGAKMDQRLEEEAEDTTFNNC